MMWIAECNIDERGRLTLPKSFLKANGLTKHTKVFVQTMYNTSDTVKLVFENSNEPIMEVTNGNKENR